MVLVDQLAAVLGDLAVSKRPVAVGPAAPADAVGLQYRAPYRWCAQACGPARPAPMISNTGVARSAGGGHPGLSAAAAASAAPLATKAAGRPGVVTLRGDGGRLGSDALQIVCSGIPAPFS